MEKLRKKKQFHEITDLLILFTVKICFPISNFLRNAGGGGEGGEESGRKNSNCNFISKKTKQKKK